jgi:hypothetical protein
MGLVAFLSLVTDSGKLLLIGERSCSIIFFVGEISCGFD